MKLFGCRLKNKLLGRARSAICVLVTASVLLTALFVGTSPALFSVNADSEADTYVLRIAPNSTGMPFFGQWVTLEKGKTYVFSTRYLYGTDFNWRVFLDHSETGADYDTSDLECEVSDDSVWSMQSIKFTVPSDAPDDGSGKAKIWVGLRGYKAAGALYYYNFKLYAVGKPEVNLFKDCDLLENGTSLNKSVWKSPFNSAIKSTLSKVTLKAAGGESLFKKPAASEPMVLALAPNSTGMPFFGQWVTLEKGKTYVFSTSYLPGTDLVQKIYLDHSGDDVVDYDASDLTGETVNDVDWSRKGIKFTVPENAPEDGSGKAKIWVGLRGYKTGETLYYYDFELYDVADPEVNLLTDGDLLEGGGTISKNVWKTPFGSAVKNTFSKVSLESIGGEAVFKKVSATEPMVMSLAPNTAKMPFFGQWVTLEKGKTYVFSTSYLPGTDLVQKIYLDHSANDVVDYDESDLTGEETEDSVWSRRGVKFTVPENAPEDGSGKVKIWVGLRGYKTEETLYYYGFELYEVNNPEVNLLKDCDLLENGTSLNRDVWKTPFNTDINEAFCKETLEAAGGEDIFKKTIATEPMVLALAPKTTKMPFFGQWVTLEKGKTYHFSACCLYGTVLQWRVYLDHTETGADYDLTDLTGEETDDSTWSRQGVKFTVPENAPEDGSGKAKVWVGIRGFYTDETLYYYDFELCEVNNPEVNLLNDCDLLENGNAINRNVWKTPFNSAVKDAFGKVTLEAAGGEGIFKKTLATEPMVLALAPNSTGMPFFGQWVTLEKGKTYTYSNCYLPGTDAIQGIYLDEKDNQLTDYDVAYDSKLSKKSLTFTVPETAVDYGNGKTRIWVGIRGYKTEQTLYYYDFKLYEVNNPEVNLLKDPDLLENASKINTAIWISPFNTAIKESYSKVTLKSAGGIEIFKRSGDTGPKMMYYTRTNRGPNLENYACFSIGIPDELNIEGQNYVFELDIRSVKGMAPYTFKCSAIDTALALDEECYVSPASVKGYKYTFNLRFKKDTEYKLNLKIFVPKGSEGYISNIYMYKADADFNKISDRDMLKGSYGDFSHMEIGNYAGLYLKQGGCIGTETGKLYTVPQYFFDTPPSVQVPAGDKMMSYASVWDAGTIAIDLPYTVKKGSTDGKNYVVALTIRPTKGRDPSKFYSTGINGELVQVYPEEVDGYKYTFYLTEKYGFSLVLEFPIDCEGYISNLTMYAADDDFKPLNSVNLATAFGKNGTFADVTMQAGMDWDGITFGGGFLNTFIDTRAMADKLKNGVIGEYGSSGGIWPIPENYFLAEKDEDWANAFMSTGANQGGTVLGEIKASTGKAIAGCEIVIKSMQSSSDTEKATSDKNGEFRFESVPVGGYKVAVVTKDGKEVLGDAFFWIEDADDIVTLSLVYDGNDLAVSSSGSTNSLTAVLIVIGSSVIVVAAVVLLLVIKRKHKKSA